MSSSQLTEQIYSGKTRSNRSGQGKGTKNEKREMSKSVGRQKGRQSKVWYAVLHSKYRDESRSSPFIAVKSEDINPDYPVLENCFIEKVKPCGFRVRPIYYRSASSQEQAEKILSNYETQRLSAATYNQIKELEKMNDYNYVASISAKGKYAGIHLYSVSTKSSIFYSLRIPASMIDSKRSFGSILFVCWYLLCRLIPAKKEKLNIAIMTNEKYLIGMLQNASNSWVKHDWKNQNGDELGFLPIVKTILNELNLQSQLTDEEQNKLDKNIFCGPRHNVYLVYVPKENLIVPEYLTSHPADAWEKGVWHSRVEAQTILDHLQNKKEEQSEDETQQSDIMTMMSSISVPTPFGIQP